MSSRRTPNTTNKTGPITTQRDLSKALMCSVSTANSYVNHHLWPFGPGPWKSSQVPEMRRWVADDLEKSNKSVSGSDDVKDLKKQELRERIRKLRISADKDDALLAQIRGTLVDREERDRAWMELIIGAKNQFLGMPDQVAPMLYGREVPEISETLRDRIEQIFRGLQIKSG